MEYPEHEKIAHELLKLIHDQGGSAKPKDCYEPLADYFKLSQVDRTGPRKDGRAGKQWHNLVQWARQRLINNEFLDGRQPGLWVITESGKKEFNRLRDYLRENLGVKS